MPSSCSLSQSEPAPLLPSTTTEHAWFARTASQLTSHFVPRAVGSQNGSSMWAAIPFDAATASATEPPSELNFTPYASFENLAGTASGGMSVERHRPSPMSGLSVCALGGSQ